MLETYLELLRESDLLSTYKNMLLRTVMLDISDVKGDSMTLLWRKLLCILLLEHAQDPVANTIYRMWNAAYPDHIIYNKKESFYRKTIKPKTKTERENSLIKK